MISREGFRACTAFRRRDAGAATCRGPAVELAISALTTRPGTWDQTFEDTSERLKPCLYADTWLGVSFPYTIPVSVSCFLFCLQSGTDGEALSADPPQPCKEVEHHLGALVSWVSSAAANTSDKFRQGLGATDPMGSAELQVAGPAFRKESADTLRAFLQEVEFLN